MNDNEKQSVQSQGYSQTDLKEVMRTFWTDSHPEYGHYKKEADALLALFKKWPRNDDIGKIAVKVSALNSLYSTRIFNIKPVVEGLALLGTKGNIDELICNGDIEAVEKIRKCYSSDRKKLDIYSFATKYCHLSNPEAYPIYDTLVDELLWEDKPIKFRRQDLRKYKTFVEALNGFKSKYKIKANCHTFDLYLWIIGKERRKQAGEAENMVDSE